MSYIKYSEEDLFDFAFRNCGDVELLDVLIKDFGLDVNWRSKSFYDTLLYQALKQDLSAAKFLISKGACVNCSLGGYPTDESSRGYLSLLDVASGFYTLRDVGGGEYLKQLGAISFENLPEDKKKQMVESVDFTRQASEGKYLYRAKEQVQLSVMTLPDRVKEKLKRFVSSCKIETEEDIQRKNTNAR